MVINLENRMVSAHKLGVAVYDRFGDRVLSLLYQCMDAHPHIFITEAERMAFMAGYHGARRRTTMGEKNG